MTVKGTMNTTMEKMISKTLSSCQYSFKCLTAIVRALSSAPGRSASDDKVADEMGSEEDSEPALVVGLRGSVSRYRLRRLDRA